MIWKAGRRTADQAQSDALEAARDGGNFTGGKFATIISAFALLFSGYSFYESVLRAPSIALYVPPQIEYTDPTKPDDPFEVFIIPLTVANDGAQTGTVLSVDLKVTNPRTKQSKLFYAAQTGPWGDESRTAFAPVSLAGKASHSAMFQFYPRNSEAVARILDFEAGSYVLELTLNTAAPKGDTLLNLPTNVKPLTFTMEIDQLDYRNFNGTGTMPMRTTDYKPAASE